MGLRCAAAMLLLGLSLQAQGFWPLVPPPPPPPGATKEELAAWPADEWAGHHQQAVLKGLFRDDLNAPPPGATVIVIRCFPSFTPPYQLEVIQKPRQAWTLKGWFLEGNLLVALADLKRKRPDLTDADAIVALSVQPAEIQVDPTRRGWAWLGLIRPGVVPELPRAIPGGTDGTLICWLESTPRAGIVEAQLQDGNSLAALSRPINRLEKRLRAVRGNTRAKTRP